MEKIYLVDIANNNNWIDLYFLNYLYLMLYYLDNNTDNFSNYMFDLSKYSIYYLHKGNIYYYNMFHLNKFPEIAKFIPILSFIVTK